MEAKSGATVFVVDEDQAHRDSLRWLIESMGFAVACCKSVQDFLASYEAGKPGCVVIDLGMPSARRFELLEQLKASRIRGPVILLSDVEDASLAQEPAGEHKTSLLRKPFRDQELFNQLRDAVGPKG
jgi:FixJ family two-component response regulator